MAIPVTAVHILRLLLQAEQNLSGLQHDMHSNAQTWRAMAVAQNPSVSTLSQYMTSAAASYQSRLGWIATAQADTVNWAKLSDMWQKLGGTGGDFLDMVNPLTAVANELATADLSTYAKIIAACDQIIAAINAPLSLWPK